MSFYCNIYISMQFVRQYELRATISVDIGGVAGDAICTPVWIAREFRKFAAGMTPDAICTPVWIARGRLIDMLGGYVDAICTPVWIASICWTDITDTSLMQFVRQYELRA